jgi:hypothetical protein
MDREEAIKLGKTEWWKEASPKQIVDFQLYEDRLCMPFSEYQKAIEKVLGRPVFTHEFAIPENLQREYEGKDPKPTLEETLRWLQQKYPHINIVFV